MSIEGGDFQCYVHDFKTANIEEWNEHCMDTPGHTEEGTTACTRCGAIVEFHNLPFHPLQADGSKGIALQCPDCSEKTHGSATITKRISGGE